MKARAEKLNADLRIESADNQGTLIILKDSCKGKKYDKSSIGR